MKGSPSSTSWERSVIDAALTDLHKEWGSGWSLISTDLREALLAKKVLAVIARQAVVNRAPGLSEAHTTLTSIMHLAELAIREDLE